MTTGSQVLTAVVEALPIAVVLVDDVTIVGWNEAAEILYGFATADALGWRVLDLLFDPDDRASVAKTFDAVRAGEQWAGDCRIRRHDGVYLVSSFRAVPAGAGSGSGDVLWAWIAADRMDQGLAEQEREVLLSAEHAARATAEEAQRRLAILATASTVLTTTMEVDELLCRLSRVLAPGSADWCLIELINADGTVEHAAVSHRDRTMADALRSAIVASPIDRRGSGPVAQVLRTGQGQLFGPEDTAVALAAAAADRGRRGLFDDFKLRSGVVVPIQARGQALGVLIMATENDDALTDEDLELAVEVAHRGALALGNARAYQREHELAVNLQRALLPATLPDTPGLEVAVRYLAATAGVLVGGDWYDVIAFDQSTAALVVGDVMGHDIEASSVMGQLRTGLRAYAYEDRRNPAMILGRLDRLMGELDLTMATCLLAIVDVDRLELRWSRAGHPPPLLLRDGRHAYLDSGEGVLLGIGAGWAPATATLVLEPGDALVLFTDGLIERRTESLTDGLDRLAQVALGLGTSDPERLCQGIVDELLPPGQGRKDDVAILVARVSGTV